jgi:hypothetical protein
VDAPPAVAEQLADSEAESSVDDSGVASTSGRIGARSTAGPLPTPQLQLGGARHARRSRRAMRRLAHQISHLERRLKHLNDPAASSRGGSLEGGAVWGAPVASAGAGARIRGRPSAVQQAALDFEEAPEARDEAVRELLQGAMLRAHFDQRRRRSQEPRDIAEGACARTRARVASGDGSLYLCACF